MSAIMTVCGEKGITPLYIPIWVAFNQAKIFGGFVGGCCISFIHFPMSRGTFLGLRTGLFRVLCSDWTEGHGPRHVSGGKTKRESRLNEIPNAQIFVFLARREAAG